jgi:hypothetical protein
MDALWSNLLSGFVGAVVGGTLSAVGAWVSIGRQLQASQRERGELAARLIAMILGEQSRAIDRVIKQRATGAGRIMFMDIDRVQANYGLFERNREWLIHVDEPSDRQAALDTLSEIQVLSGLLRDQVQKWESAQPNAAPGLWQNDQQRIASLEQVNAALGSIVGRLTDLKSECDRLIGRYARS